MFLSKKSCTAQGPSTKTPTTPITPTPMTMSTSLRRPFLKSSCSPAPARRASFGSNAACTAWKRMIRARARKNPRTNAATSACCELVARTVAIRIGVAQALGEDGPAQQVSEFVESSTTAIAGRARRDRVGPGATSARENGWDREAQPIRHRVGDAREPQDGRGQEPDAPLRPEDHAVGAKRPFPDSVPRVRCCAA